MAKQSQPTATNLSRPRGGWDDPDCGRPTSTFRLCAVREHGDCPSHPVNPFFTSLLEAKQPDDRETDHEVV